MLLSSFRGRRCTRNHWVLFTLKPKNFCSSNLKFRKILKRYWPNGNYTPSPCNRVFQAKSLPFLKLPEAISKIAVMLSDSETTCWRSAVALFLALVQLADKV